MAIFWPPFDSWYNNNGVSEWVWDLKVLTGAAGLAVLTQKQSMLLPLTGRWETWTRFHAVLCTGGQGTCADSNSGFWLQLLSPPGKWRPQNLFQTTHRAWGWCRQIGLIFEGGRKVFVPREEWLGCKNMLQMPLWDLVCYLGSCRNLHKCLAAWKYSFDKNNFKGGANRTIFGLFLKSYFLDKIKKEDMTLLRMLGALLMWANKGRLSWGRWQGFPVKTWTCVSRHVVLLSKLYQ